MSTSLLYHAFNIAGYRYRKTEYFGREIVITIEQPTEDLSCSSCGSRRVIRRGSANRMFRAPCFAFKKILIKLAVQRVQCRDCGVVRQVKVGFADENRRFIRQFERYALDLYKHMTIKSVAAHLGVSWGVIKDIVKRYLHRKFSKPKLKHLKKIAIDEIAIGRGHKFKTVVMDLESGAVVYVGKGKDARALGPFFKRLKAAKAKVEAVAIDMSKAYIQAVNTNLPHAKIVFDHFHVIKLYNEKLSELRRDLFREATDLLKKQALKGTRWLLLKNPENLNDQKSERKRLQEALDLNEPLAKAYYMKDELRLFWKQPDKVAAEKFLDCWIITAASSGVRMLINFAKTLQLHKQGLLAWYDYRISTGPLEATNNKIKTMQRQAYGLRDQEFFQLKIYAIHLSKYALLG